MLAIVGWIVFGLIVGLIARAVMPGRDNMSLPVTIMLGILGALAAGWAGRALGWYNPEDGAGYLMSVVGALVVLGIYHAIARRTSHGSVTKMNRSDRDFPRKVA